jgi:hypothetical protein
MTAMVTESWVVVRQLQASSAPRRRPLRHKTPKRGWPAVKISWNARQTEKAAVLCALAACALTAWLQRRVETRFFTSSGNNKAAARRDSRLLAGLKRLEEERGKRKDETRSAGQKRAAGPTRRHCALGDAAAVP